HTQTEHLAQRSGNLKRRPRLFLSLTSLQEIREMVGRRRRYFRQSVFQVLRLPFRDNLQRTSVRPTFKGQVLTIDDLARIKFCRFNSPCNRWRNVRLQTRNPVTLGNLRQIIQPVVPSNVHCRHSSPFGEMKFNRRRLREKEGIMPFQESSLYLRRQTKFEKLVCGI